MNIKSEKHNKTSKNLFKCSTCESTFTRKPSRVKNNLAVFCSQACYKKRPEVIHKPFKESDWIGLVSNHLTIESFAGFVTVKKRKNGVATEGSERSWVCSCNCGNKITLTTDSFNRRKSCGCLISQPTHGHLYNSNRLLAAVKQSFSVYKKGAVKRNLSFSLTLTEFQSLVTEPCHYCKRLVPNKTRYKSDEGKVSIVGVDRKDNNIGYEINNCLSCCFICNRMKSNQTYEDFINLCKLIGNSHVYQK